MGIDATGRGNRTGDEGANIAEAKQRKRRQQQRKRDVMDRQSAGSVRLPPRSVRQPATRAYVARRTTEGLSKLEIIRCLKRYLARELSRSWLQIHSW